jgi:hypothetical protein
VSVLGSRARDEGENVVVGDASVPSMLASTTRITASMEGNNYREKGCGMGA